MWWLAYRIIFLVWVSLAGNALAQTPNTTRKSLEVEMFAEPIGATSYTPTNIHLHAFVTMVGARAGDTVTLDFYANTNKLGSRKTVWHDAVFPPNDPHRFHYLHVLPAGFDPVEFV